MLLLEKSNKDKVVSRPRSWFLALTCSCLLVTTALLTTELLGLWRADKAGHSSDHGEVVVVSKPEQTPTPQIGSRSDADHRNFSLTVQQSNYKTILLWTTWFGLDWSILDEWAPHDPFISSSTNPNDKCLFSSNRSDFAGADAVVFHGWDINEIPNPSTRKSYQNQRFVFYLLECPDNGRILPKHWKKLSSIGFNWFMSYMTSADIFNPYSGVLPGGRFSRASTAKKISQFVESFADRPSDAVWIVSHSYVASKRLEIVENLARNGIKVDIFGDCTGRKPDVEWARKGGYEAFFQRYRYYLSFENSLCDDYITEKAYNGLNASQLFGLIPVVYGGANYSAFLPEGSYIDVLNFTSVKQLADSMKSLARKNDGEAKQRLASYYQWHFDYHVASQSYSHNKAWQRLCSRLWEPSSDHDRTQIIPDIRARYGSCRKAPANLLLS